MMILYSWGHEGVGLGEGVGISSIVPFGIPAILSAGKSVIVDHGIPPILLSALQDTGFMSIHPHIHWKTDEICMVDTVCMMMDPLMVPSWQLLGITQQIAVSGIGSVLPHEEHHPPPPLGVWANPTILIPMSMRKRVFQTREDSICIFFDIFII